MNYIGKKLKSLRQELGLTQTEMAAGVISVSFYSKVERGLNDIGVNDFLDILQKHNVSPQSFLGDYKLEKDNKRKVISLMNSFLKAAYANDDYEINSIIKLFEKIQPQTPFIKYTVLATKLIANTHDDKALKRLSNAEKSKIKKLIFRKDTDENEYYRIILMANLIQIYNVDDASFLVRNMIRKYQNFNKMDRKMLSAISALMINYIDWCMKKGRKELCHDALLYIEQLPSNMELAFIKILGKFYEDLIAGKRKEAKQILNILKESGYEVNVKRIVKINFQIWKYRYFF